MSERDIAEIMRLLGTAIKGINETRSDLSSFRVEVKSEFDDVRAEVHEVRSDLNSFRMEVKSDFDDVRTEVHEVSSDLNSFRQDVNQRFDQVDNRFDRMEKRNKVVSEDLMQLRVTDLELENRIEKFEKEAA